MAPSSACPYRSSQIHISNLSLSYRECRECVEKRIRRLCEKSLLEIHSKR
jgi:hypothetical protein